MPYLKSEYGKEFDYDAPVKLLDAMMHEQAQDGDQQVPVPTRLPLASLLCMRIACCLELSYFTLS